MSSLPRSSWAGVLRSLPKLAPALQVAALCHRDGDAGVEVLLITSSSGRWILPKGWPIDGLSQAEAAKEEAWEEAGVKKGDLGQAALGVFLTEKRFDNGAVIPCQIEVYTISVTSIVDDFPEAHKRKRKWVSVEDAIDLVDEPGLRDVLKAFSSS